MVEFLEDVCIEIKSFRPVTYFDLGVDSCIIKDVVLEYLVSIGDGYIEQRNVFKFVDDIIYHIFNFFPVIVFEVIKSSSNRSPSMSFIFSL